MSQSVSEILSRRKLTRDDLIYLLSVDEAGSRLIFEKAVQIRKRYVGNKVYFRGLIEYSNRCTKNCYYCGIRSHNTRYARYQLSDEELLSAVMFAYANRYASIVIQSGERSDRKFVPKIESLLKEIQRLTGGRMHVTLSLGEQSEETYRRWFKAGAHRYLLRIEVSEPELYRMLHPADARHDFNARLNALRLLRKTGYQVGTGVMIGLPFQTLSDLASDLMFFRDFDIDMIGMGPYIEHQDTPLYQYRDQLLPHSDRMLLSLKMVALARILMKDINIAATTAMQTLDPQGREKALLAGANVIMPNLTPLRYKQRYLLYEGKPGIEDDAGETLSSIENDIYAVGNEIGYDEWGDSPHYHKRKMKR